MMSTPTSNHVVRRSFGLLSALLFAAIATGCGGGGGGGGSNPVVDPPELLTVSGTWLMTMSVDNDECGVFEAGTELDTQTIVIRQNDAEVVLHAEDGEEFLSGTLGLDRVMRLEAEDGTEIDLTVTPSADELAFTFTGTTELESTQPSGDPCRLILRLDGNRASLIEQVAAAPVHRVNCGGEEVIPGDGTLAWGADTSDNPSPFRTSGVTFPLSVGDLDDTVPADTPIEVFESLVFDFEGEDEMVWNFPVEPGSYEVRLYFGESFFGDAGVRVFNTRVEGEIMLENFDILQETERNVGIMRSTTVEVTDGNLEILFEHVIQNPVIAAIEIIRL